MVRKMYGVHFTEQYTYTCVYNYLMIMAMQRVGTILVLVVTLVVVHDRGQALLYCQKKYNHDKCN